ncbi:hypothetical protein D3C75_907130 [compost metagenome]
MARPPVQILFRTCPVKMDIRFPSCFKRDIQHFLDNHLHSFGGRAFLLEHVEYFIDHQIRQSTVPRFHRSQQLLFLADRQCDNSRTAVIIGRSVSLGQRANLLAIHISAGLLVEPVRLIQPVAYSAETKVHT